MKSNNKKKILFLVGNMNNAGGTERVCSIVANELVANGYEVLIVSIAEGTDPFFPLNNSIKIRSLFKTSGRALYRIPNIIHKLRSLFKSEKIDTLIVVESMSVLFTLPAVQKLSINHICWEHFIFEEDLGKKSRHLARQLAAVYCDYVITLTDADKQKWLQCTKHKAEIISIPNPSPFAPQNYIKEMSTKTVLAVGRLTYSKGFDLLLQAWKKVHEKFPDWKLNIVGEGEERNRLESFINKNHLNHSVKLVGNTNEIDTYYRNSEIFCLSSRYEGFGMVLIEALAFGLPIVSFDCQAGPSEILEGTGSILVPKENIEQLSHSLIELMANERLRKEISIKNIKRSESYQPSSIIKKWERII